MEETQRQKKIAALLQRDLADVLQRSATDAGMRGILISVTKVKVTVDLSIAKVYLSVFPNNKGKEIIEATKNSGPLIKHELAHIDNIEKSLKGTENPIQNPDLLDKRKRS